MLCLALSVCACVWCVRLDIVTSTRFFSRNQLRKGGGGKKKQRLPPDTRKREKRKKTNRVVIVFVLCSGLVGELCGLAFWRRQDSSVQNDADVASAETAEGFGSLSGHEGKQQTKHSKTYSSFFSSSFSACLYLELHERLPCCSALTPHNLPSGGWPMSQCFHEKRCMIDALAVVFFVDHQMCLFLWSERGFFKRR